MAGILAWIAQSGVVQGIIIGATLAFLTAILILNLVARRLTTTDNGWRQHPPLRPARQRRARAGGLREGAAGRQRVRRGRVLEGDSGCRGPAAHRSAELPAALPAGAAAAPPRLLVADRDRHRRIHGGGCRRPGRHRRSGELAQGADGAVDIVLRHDPPPGAPQNWLAVPSGRFSLMLRVYLPGSEILDGSYRVAPVVRAAELATAV
ncbi:DUF1214 domain-containing protein [Microbacterium elymi]|uniref:DUF1214 domain-containing protein n=1 Tax=Microbacterium elymi TaxID=2909587 RepID=A0ABY5NJ98_9MICO|nr:DUF1214 domain-containing protein [Microbacterium elymi]UUT35156.1 DUF1214 domain-containing protein [Microbacterium elymi]